MAGSGVRVYQGGATMKMLASVLVLLSVVGVGRADDKVVIKELEKAHVVFYGRGAIFENARGVDALVDRLAALSNIEELTVCLGGSDLTDAGLAALGCLKAIDELGLSSTAVTDAGLKNLVGVRVRCLGLRDCAGVTDAALASIARMKGLRAVILDGTRVTDAGMERLAALSDLEWVFLDGTAVTDAGVKRLMRLRGLRGLSLCGTKVTDAGLREVGSLSDLKYLFLDGTAVTDATLRRLEGLHGLFSLSLHNCPNVTDEGVARLKKALPNCLIDR
jgi:internalin A